MSKIIAKITFENADGSKKAVVTITENDAQVNFNTEFIPEIVSKVKAEDYMYFWSKFFKGIAQ